MSDFSHIICLTISFSQAIRLTISAVVAVKWIPSWLAEKYSLIYIVKGVHVFDFEEAKKLLGIEDKRRVSVVLAQLRNRGFLISWRDSVDPRRKFFRLLSPEDVVFAFGIQSSADEKSVLGKLREALKHLEYVVGGAYASFKHHGYTVPGKVDLHVKREDVDKWVAFLADREVAVSIDGIPAEKPRKESIHIHSDLTEDMLRESVVVDGIRYFKPEVLVVEGLKIEDRFGLMDALAILISKRKELEWRKLVHLAEREAVVRKLGCTLEIINHEAKREVFPEEKAEEIRKKTDLSYLMIFPKSMEATPFREEEKKYYTSLGKRWNMKIHLSRAFISKIVTDLVR